jgi:hypothetical protein
MSLTNNIPQNPHNATKHNASHLGVTLPATLVHPPSHSLSNLNSQTAAFNDLHISIFHKYCPIVLKKMLNSASGAFVKHTNKKLCFEICAFNTLKM